LGGTAAPRRHLPPDALPMSALSAGEPDGAHAAREPTEQAWSSPFPPSLAFMEEPWRAKPAAPLLRLLIPGLVMPADISAQAQPRFPQRTPAERRRHNRQRGIAPPVRRFSAALRRCRGCSGSMTSRCAAAAATPPCSSTPRPAGAPTSCPAASPTSPRRGCVTTRASRSCAATARAPTARRPAALPGAVQSATAGSLDRGQPRAHPPPQVPGHRPPRPAEPLRRLPRRPGRRVLGVHPHRLRHTLTTQAINRGMRLEAIAAPHINTARWR
jgi:hypothetical protein